MDTRKLFCKRKKGKSDPESVMSYNIFSACDSMFSISSRDRTAVVVAESILNDTLTSVAYDQILLHTDVNVLTCVSLLPSFPVPEVALLF